MNSVQSDDSTNNTDVNDTQDTKTTFVNELWDWIKSILFALAIVLIIHQFIFNLSTVEGQSMEPTLEENEWLFVNKIIYLTGSPSHGDIVILKDPRGMKQYLVKRIVGVPGDTVEIHNQRLFVNGSRVNEFYTDTLIENGDLAPVTVGEDRYFVMGDNRYKDQSLDSRSNEIGTVPEDLIKGRAQFIIWPLTKVGGL
jgi:signal peptidase I